MKNIKTTLTTNAVFSDDGTKRYLLTKTWDSSKTNLAIIMLAPSDADGVTLDSTTMLVMNNASRLGYGSVTILNLFATLNDFGLRQAELEDPENLDIILSAAQTADVIVYAAGVGKAKNKQFQERQRQVLEVLQPVEHKLFCLCDARGGARLQHPLSPAVRTWELSPLKISELVKEEEVKPEPAKKSKTPIKREACAE